MKLWFTTIVALLIFTGCASNQQNTHLQNKNAQQAMIIQQQKVQIDTLRAKLNAKSKVKRTVRKRSLLPKPPKKNIKLKKVEDNNYTSGYMYPSEIKKKEKPVKVAQATTSVSNSMDKAQCIVMIGQEKFDKYTQMFGSEAASLKRCKMLKAMKQ